ncbi:MAG: trypsin-like peptidase domain-containing protein [Candidatus Obscuribacterales bacterium]|nr:trypsin-like peptidase domain-containing protein [Candidatus Obscuribacterales bacterium]
MPTSQKSRSKDGLVRNPGQLSNALANVISQETGREVVLGQAWLAAPDRLITCGHVVERYVNAPSLLFVRFPASGNKYPLSRIRLHPSFVRQPDQLVKFDVALLEVNLQQPEASASPLPFSYEQELSTNQTLWAIRYPAHLGQLSAAPQPLTQEGRFLGPLRIHDTFHLLHDLPLSPGDSGAPITDGENIIAIHCGDTATLPGLNLPTTSIRLALWIDALRELGISETTHASADSRKLPLLPAFITFILAAALSALASFSYLSEQAKKTWVFSNPELMPLKVSFNEAVDAYKADEDVVITITPGSKCFVFLFQINSADDVAVLYPQFGQDGEMLQKGEPRLINKFGSTKLTANASQDRFYLVAVRGDTPKGEELSREILKKEDRATNAPEGSPLLTRGKNLLERIKQIKDSAGNDVLFVNFIGPHSK